MQAKFAGWYISSEKLGYPLMSATHVSYTGTVSQALSQACQWHRAVFNLVSNCAFALVLHYYAL